MPIAEALAVSLKVARILDVLKVQGERLDDEYLRAHAERAGLADLLARDRAEAG